MAGLIGADPAALEALAQRAKDASADLRRVQRVLNGPIHTTPWFGPFAGGFRSRWDGELGGRLMRAATFLDGAAAALVAEAQQQRDASSGARDGAGAPAPIAHHDPLAQRRADLEARFDATRRQMEQDLEAAKRHLAELCRRRDERDGGFGDFIADHNPFDEGDGERLDREIREAEAKVNRLEQLLKGDRNFLKVDASGDGRIIEVHGDLAAADHVAIHVPGMGTSIDDYLRGGHTDAAALFGRMDLEASGEVAVVAFLDYDAPDAWAGGPEERARAVAEAGGSGLAQDGANNLRQLVNDLGQMGVDRDSISVVAHSYGSVVTGLALADGMDVGEAIVLGSPGLGHGVDDISDIGTETPVWAARGGDDWLVPGLPRHGENPADPGFGAQGFDGGSGGHSDYFEGGVLDRITKIVVHGHPDGPRSST